MLDRYWFGEVNRISPEAPVPVVHVQRSEERPVVQPMWRAMPCWARKVSLLSVVGNDEPAQALEKLLSVDGVHTRLHRDPALSTTIKLRVLGRQQQLLRIDFENLPTHEILRNKLADFATLLPEHDVIVLSDYGKGGLAHIAEMIAMARAAEQDRAGRPEGEDDYSKYSGADLLTPNPLGAASGCRPVAR